jgi:hypothetical protein
MIRLWLFVALVVLETCLQLVYFGIFWIFFGIFLEFFWNIFGIFSKFLGFKKNEKMLNFFFLNFEVLSRGTERVFAWTPKDAQGCPRMPKDAQEWFFVALVAFSTCSYGAKMV